MFTPLVLLLTVGLAFVTQFTGLAADIDTHRSLVEGNLGYDGEPRQLAIDAGKLRGSLAFLRLVLGMALILFMLNGAILIGVRRCADWLDAALRGLGIGITFITGTVAAYLHRAFVDLANMTIGPFDRVIAAFCLLFVSGFFYYRGFRPFRKGAATLREARCELLRRGRA